MKLRVCCTFLALSFCTILGAQWLYVDEYRFHERDLIKTMFPDDFEVDTEIPAKGDTASYALRNRDGKLLIAGNYYLKDRHFPIKFGDWDFYYPSGQLQSKRRYDERGRLMEIVSLQSPTGSPLAQGYAKQNDDGTYYGHMYKYDEQGNHTRIVRYSRGYAEEEFEVGRFEDHKLKEPRLRRYYITENDFIDVLKFEEAVKAQKSDPKPILLRITTSGNGYSRRMEDYFGDSKIAKIIKDNFHFVYLSLNSDEDISFEKDGEVLTFTPDPYTGRKRQHTLITKFFKTRISATPTFFLVDENLDVIAQSKGASLSVEKLIKHLNYFIDRYYHIMTYEAYEDSTF